MYTARDSFFILKICGLWRPSNWPDNSIKTRLYESYTVFLSFLIITVTIFEFVYLISTIDDVEAFANNSFMLLSMIGMCGKATNVLNRRDRIIELTSILNNDVCQPNDPTETTIQRKFDAIVRSNTFWYAALTESTVVMMYIVSVIQDIPKKVFPFETWLPWDCTTLAGYWIGYMHQIIAHGAGATINVACDSLVAALMVQTCAQFNILKQRFATMPKLIQDTIESFHDVKMNVKDTERLEVKILSQYVRHHLKIIEFAIKIHSIFDEIIFLQFTISTLVLCVSVYQLSTLQLFSTEFLSIMLYLSCMLVQVFFLCYYGSEITLEVIIKKIHMIFMKMSQPDRQSVNVGNAIYDMKWYTLCINTKKSLLTIMIRTLRPIEYISGRVITLNLDSFNSLIKLSYSAYNLLQQSSE